MLNATLKSLLARKLRLLLASFAVLLGVSFVSGAFTLTDTLNGVFDKLFASIGQNTSVTVQSQSDFSNNPDDLEPVPQSVLDTVRKVPGVREVIGNVSDPKATLVLPSGKALSKSGPPTLGLAFHAGDYQASLALRTGKAPSGLGQVVIDAQTAKDEHLKVGDQVGVIGKGAPIRVTIVGTVGFKTTDSLAGATLVGFDPASAQKVFGTPGAWTDLDVAAVSGVSQIELRNRILSVLPKGFEAKTEAQSTTDNSKQFKQALGFFNTFLLAFAGISLFVGAFLIFNTFSMLVAQRTRELALMRALGASQGQVTRSVLVEALAVGLTASIGGFAVGIGVAVGLRSLLGALGIDLPGGATVVELRTFIVCLAVGVIVTAIAALVPARKAARVAPVEAMRDSGPAEDRSLVRRSSVGAGLLALGIAGLVGGLSSGTLALVGFGAALSFIGVAVISPLFARPVVRVLGFPFAKLGVPGMLGRGNAMRSPRRTSSTAAALMIGLALVAAISTLGASAKKSVTHIISTSLGADLIVHTEQFDGFQPAVGAAVAGQPGLASVAQFRAGIAKIGKAGKSDVQGVDPSVLPSVLKLKVLKGEITSLPGDSLAISKGEATNLGATVGDTVPVEWQKTGKRPYTIRGVFDDNQLAGGYLVSDANYDVNVTDKELVVVAVKVASGTSLSQAEKTVKDAVKAFPNVKVQDQAQFVKTQADQVDTLLNAITGLLVLSVVIAILGIINTLALSVVERTRELGLLRAVGLQRRQVKRMIRVESVVISVFGALLGILVGLGFGYALVAALHDQGITEFAIPTLRIVIVLVVAALGGVVAAALPARRAARMNVLEAVSAT